MDPPSLPAPLSFDDVVSQKQLVQYVNRLVQKGDVPMAVDVTAQVCETRPGTTLGTKCHSSGILKVSEALTCDGTVWLQGAPLGEPPTSGICTLNERPMSTRCPPSSCGALLTSGWTAGCHVATRWAHYQR